MPFNMFPYTNFHDLNLDWLLKKIQEGDTGAVAELEVKNRLQEISLLNRFGGRSKYPITFNSNIVTVNYSVPDYDYNYWPVLTTHMGVNMAHMSASLRSISIISNVSADRKIGYGLPAPANAAGSFMISDAIKWTDGNGMLCSANLIYNTDGELLFFDPDNDSIPANTDFLIDVDFETSGWNGDFVFPEITVAINRAATEWIISHRGLFVYSNVPYYKCNAENAQDQTDCAGVIYCAFKNAGIVVPDFAQPQAGYGTVIAYSDVYKDLDFTDAREGDLVFFIHPQEGYAHHVAFYDGQKLWHVNTSYAIEYNDPAWIDPNTGKIRGPQPVDGTYTSGSNAGTQTKETYGKYTNIRLIMRWSENPYGHGSNTNSGNDTGI